MYEHDRQAGCARTQHLVLCEILRALVVPEEMLEVDQRILGGRAPVLGDAERRHRARVDESVASRALGGTNDVHGAADVYVVEEIGVGGPEPIDGGQVEHGRHVHDRVVERGRIADVADDSLDR